MEKVTAPLNPPVRVMEMVAVPATADDSETLDADVASAKSGGGTTVRV